MLRPAGKFSLPLGNDSPTTPSLSAEVRVVSPGKALARSAQELLEDYVRTGSQAPFEEVVRRYAGMVFNVCYQILKDSHDAEDATQAVFLALAVQAKTTNGVKYLAPWLQKVAQRLSLDVRRSKTRRKAREERHSQMRLQMGIENDPTRQPGMDELKIILRDELDKLPSKYRLPLVLHYFGGLKPEEISRELGCKASTLGVRLHRGRKMLADLLSERGIVVNGSMLSIALTACVQARISETLVHSTAHAAGAYAMQGSFGAAITPQVLGFKQIASQGIFLSKVKAAVAAGILAAAAATGAAELVNRVVPDSWRFNIRTELNEWLKPTFTSPLPELRVDAGETNLTALATSGGTHYLDSNLIYAPSGTAENASLSTVSSAPSSVAVGSLLAPATDPRDTPYGETFAGSRASDGASLPAPVTRSTGKAVEMPGFLMSSGGEDILTASSSGGGAGGGGAVIENGRRPILVPPPPAQVVQNPNGTSKAPVQPFMPKVSDHLAIASPAGQIQNFVFDRKTKVSTENFTVGGQGSSTLVAEAGTLSIGKTLTVGDSFGGTGAVTLDKSSTVYASNVAIGEDGTGILTVSGNAQLIANTITAGRNSSGTINLNGGSIESKQLSVGLWNDGVVYQQDGIARMSNFLGNIGLIQLGVGASSDGTYYLRGGTVDAGKQSIGVNGFGHLYIAGGMNSVQMLEMGVNRGASGSVQVPSGTLQFTRTMPDSPVPNQWIVGQQGRGAVVLGSATSEAIINEVGYGEGTDLVIRGDASGEGRLRGWGRLMLTGTLDQSGEVIADGFGSAKTLDLSTFAGVNNSIDNAPDGTNGWYAVDGGRLRLPINRSAQPGSMLVDSYTFGESTDDATLDLVNALRVAFDPKLDEFTPVAISLVAGDHPEIPAYANGSFVSLYETNFSSLPVGTVSLTLRYDAVAIGGGEPRVLAWQNGFWMELDASQFQIDSANHLILASTAPSNYYAIAVPEPASVGFLLLAGALLSRRRRS